MDLVDELKNLLNRTATYSSCGGGNSFIQLFEFDKGYVLWIAWWWEIWRYGELIACANDDDTPVIGKMAKAASRLVGKRLLGINIDPDYSLGLFFEDGYEFWTFTDEPDKLYDGFYYWEFVNWISRTAYTINSDREVVVSSADE